MKLPIDCLGRFSTPIFLIVVLLLWQLVLLPRTLPKSHYQVLGVTRDATMEAIIDAFKQLNSQNLLKGENHAITKDMIEIHHAYKILSDPLKRRDYDSFGIDELQEEVKNAQKKLGGGAALDLEQLFPGPFNYEPLESQTQSLTLENFGVSVEGKEALLIQIYSIASRKSLKFASVWEKISTQLEGVARFGRVELGERKLASSFAEKNRVSGHRLFRYGLPALVAFPSECKKMDCLSRYAGEITTDGVVNWFATQVLRLPQILYYSPQTLVMNLIQKSGPHKVKVVIFSMTGERAAPFLRQAAKDYRDYAAFGLVLWRQENATFWENMLGVESAPSIVFLKDPGLQPVTYYGSMNSSTFHLLMKDHKSHVLPQLRSITAVELGCDEMGHSLAGTKILTWYCVLVAGRPGFELSQMRGVLRGVQDNLKNLIVPGENDDEPLQSFLIAASAFKAKRLTLAWLDGEIQKQRCYFYLNSETVYETCGPKNYPEMSDVPRIFLVRYKRDSNEDEKSLGKKKRFNSIWDKMLEEEESLASQIVARYNGSMETSEILAWIAEMIREGDSKTLPFYKRRAPALVPEESNGAWIKHTRTYVSAKSEGLFERIRRFMLGFLDYARDPKLAPLLVLVITLYMGGLFFKSKQDSRQFQQQLVDPIVERETTPNIMHGGMESPPTATPANNSTENIQTTNSGIRKRKKDGI